MTDPTNETDAIAQSPNPALARRQQLATLIPEAFSEGQFDVAALKRASGCEAVIEGGEPLRAQCGGKGRLQHLVGVALARGDMKPREIIVIDGVFHDSDPLKSNLDLQCRDTKIKFTCL